MLHFFWRHMRRGERGFTLIELLIVVAIIAILAAILIPNFLRARAQSQVSASKGNMKNIATALESYFVDNNSYPGTTIAEMTARLQGPPVYVRAVPLDPCTRTAYTYTAAGTPPTDYVLYSPTYVGTNCAGIVPGNQLSYTPGGGLSP